MYIDCIYSTYASTKNNVSAPQYKPSQCSEPINSDFQKYLACIGDEESPYPTYPVKSPYPTYPVETPYPTYPVGSPYPTYPIESPYQTCPLVVVPTPQTPGVFDIGNYYLIPESEVVQGIREIRHVINNEDLSAKSDVETFGWIEQRFIEAFGNDFMMARNLNLPSSWFYMIGIEFTNTLSKHIDDPAQANRVRLFGDASTDEIKNSIRESFPEVLTNRDLFLMVNEMRDAGVLDSSVMRLTGEDGTDRYFDTLDLLRSYARLSTQTSSSEFESLLIEEQDMRWSGILNNPITILDLLRLFNAWVTNSIFVMGNDVAPFLTNFLGGTKNSDGLFVIDSNPGGTKGNTHGNGYANHARHDGGTNSGTNSGTSSGINGSTNKVASGYYYGGYYGDYYGGYYGGEYDYENGYEYGNGYANGYEYGNGYESRNGHESRNNYEIRSGYENRNGYEIRNGYENGYSGENEEKDWSNFLNMMMREIDEYNELIRSRMQIINEGEHTVIEDGNEPYNGKETPYNPGYETPGYESPGYENP